MVRNCGYLEILIHIKYIMKYNLSSLQGEHCINNYSTLRRIWRNISQDSLMLFDLIINNNGLQTINNSKMSMSLFKEDKCGRNI